MTTTERLRPGDLVEIKTPDEILRTLDADGTLDRLPFMPEMAEFCGKRFRVSKRALKACYSGTDLGGVREFRGGDVVLLEGVRCSGGAHDGCQKACAIFWREAWLRKVDARNGSSRNHSPSGQTLLARLKTSAGPRTYFCQASEILRATEPLSRWGRFGKCVADVRAGNCTAWQMARRIAIWLFWRTRRKLLGVYARGSNTATPMESLNLQPGEHVEVKPMEEIVATLNAAARNRGLYFSPDMRLLCGARQRVARKIDRIIVDGTGEMRRLHNTVYLEGSLCGCAHAAFGGCSRCEFVYWREIWLRRSEALKSNEATSQGLPVAADAAVNRT